MATPKKTRSGSWTIQVYIGCDKEGKRKYKRITAPTKADVLYEAAKLKRDGYTGPEETMTLGECIDAYIASCEFLSPTTVAGYQKIRRTMFQDLMDKNVHQLTSRDVQEAINAESRRVSRRGIKVSPKSVRNAYGLIRASVKAQNVSFDVKLPKDDPKFIELPDAEEIIKAVRGTDIELPCMLAMWLSLSMSEVRGLRFSSIRNGCLYIDQVVVDVDGRPVVKKKAKVESRNRVLALPEYLCRLISDTTLYDEYVAGRVTDRYLVEMRYEYLIRRRLNKLVPGITFHQLRHMNASIMLKLGVPDKYAMERGGWSTPSVMKRVYQHTFSDERHRVDEAVDAYFEALLNENATLTCNTRAVNR